ncbi:MAG: hypothetical protein KGL44_10895 [Sphingomonadales bacterium]|nr:hypothetical protein [Sphingomonadales bacterium]
MDRAALYTKLDTYLAALAARDHARLDWAAGALTSENNVMLDPGDGLWGTIDLLGTYDLRFADVAARQVGFFGVVHEHKDESALSLRLQFDAAGAIMEAETIVVRQQDSGIKFLNPRYWDKAEMNEPPAVRNTRAEMLALADGYFSTLQQNDGTLHTAFHPQANRVENGVQTTHNPEFAYIVPVAALGCEEQFRMGNYRYDDRLRGRRFPLVDEERGLVLAFGFIDHCGRLQEYQLTDGRTVQSPVRYPHSFYLAELFKIDDGMIRQIEANFITVPYHMKSPWDEQ